MYLFCMHNALHGTTNMTSVFAFSSPKVVAKALKSKVTSTEFLVCHSNGDIFSSSQSNFVPRFGWVTQQTAQSLFALFQKRPLKRLE